MSDPRELQELVQTFHRRLQECQPTVAVIGDMILDHHLEGTPAGPHPDIGVPILRDAVSHESCGGAANIAIALTRLGVRAALFGVIGADLPGRQLENLLDRQTFSSSLVTERGWPTPLKHWIHQRQDGRLSLLYRVDQDKPLAASAREQLVGEFRARCSAGFDVAVLVDHGLGAIGAESLALIELARERGAKLAAIPRTRALAGRALDAIVINAPEMRLLSGQPETADPRALAARYAQQYAQDVFLTLLDEGIYACAGRGGSAGTLVEGYPLSCAHWMGARDMATAIVALGLGLGLPTAENARLANLFRHLVASQRGNGRVTWQAVYQFVELGEGPRP